MTKSSRPSEDISLIGQKRKVKIWVERVREAENAVNDILKEFDLKPVEPRLTFDDPHSAINLVFNRFRGVAQQFTFRHGDRDTIIINDEYDVQDLLHSLLKLFFDDVRDEEHAPSFAGVNPRIDILLKEEQILIEVKKARKGYTTRHIRNDLIIDREQYQTHPDCKFLYCFIYDPERRIKNPAAIVRDISGFAFGFETKVVMVN